MNIGIKIKELRLEKKITQEELASSLMVSTQAVSKWENGGLPDVTMIPQIAKFFNVSSDYLFDLESSGLENIEQKIIKFISSHKTEKERFNKMFELIYLMEMSVCGNREYNEDFIKEAINSDFDRYSQYISENGICLMGLQKDRLFAALFPKLENEDYSGFIRDKEKQLQFIKDLSNEDFYDALILLNKRGRISFTSDLFVKKLNITKERALEIIERLSEYDLVSSNTLEINDEEVKIYQLACNPAIIGLFNFIDLIVNRPNNFYFSVSDNNIKLF